ncbi:cytochrome c oxidase subunit 2A [Brevibacillus fluminis]|uniref:Cytochrome c oxidase subunit 2A n=1 Tax=Brevibacillus fluminis TaxID=511487 RepID=A0A3M8DQL3_9BACL|nr:cytochrome c oxidase subunit 2A [Brevibacillus fluminis]RNB89819.1 cytochrome c oxidase subunit 2A [Brevibacillus fluminis]
MGRPGAPKRNENETDSLKGTLVSVLLLGAFIVVTWLAVFYLFLERS